MVVMVMVDHNLNDHAHILVEEGVSCKGLEGTDQMGHHGAGSPGPGVSSMGPGICRNDA